LLLIPYTPGFFTRDYALTTKKLALVNIAVFVLLQVFPHMILPLELTDESLWSFRLLSYQFVHASFFHLFGNVAFLLAFAPVIEEKLGGTKTLLLYLFGGVIAGQSWIFMDQSMGAPLIGASGSISALMGVSLILRPYVPMPGILWIFIFLIRVGFPVWAWAVYFFIMDYFNFFASLFGGPVDNVAYSAHIGGFVGAFVLVLFLRQFGFIKAASSDLISQMTRKSPLKRTKNFQSERPSFQKDLEMSPEKLLLQLEKGHAVEAERILKAAELSRGKGESIQAYRLLQSWMERNEQHSLAAAIACELGMICLRDLNRLDLAKAWLLDARRRHPDSELEKRIETALAVLR
jgi:membrane associated rhomboid family serine protease